jgi:hypothetical protein
VLRLDAADLVIDGDRLVRLVVGVDVGPDPSGVQRQRTAVVRACQREEEVLPGAERDVRARPRTT